MDESRRLTFEQALKLWDSFRDEVLYKNRFMVKHPVLDYVKKMAEENIKIIAKDTILYRARIFDKDDTYFINYLNSDFKLEGLDNIKALMLMSNKAKIDSKKISGFWGYNESDSFVPIVNSRVVEGRTNPALIIYLYTAESPYTALAEVRPYLDDCISVAEIKVAKELKVVDFSYQGITNSNSLGDELLFCIVRDFSAPINTNKNDYIPTQYISEYLKGLGYDGIRFDSSLNKGGYNVTIFNYNDCKAVSSKLYKIKDICIDSRCIAPLHEQDLMHPKLKSYKEHLLQRPL